MSAARLTLAALLAASCILAGCQRDDESALPVVISLPAQGVTNVAKATLTVDYSGSDAKILSEGGVPSCAFVLPGISGDFADNREGMLTIHTSGPRALRGPADIAVCRMEPIDASATAVELAKKLSVHVTAAEDPAGKVIDVTVKAPKGQAPERSEAAIEAAQAEAVKAAEAISAAAPAPTLTETPAGAASGSTAPGAANLGGSNPAASGFNAATGAPGQPGSAAGTMGSAGPTARATPPPRPFASGAGAISNPTGVANPPAPPGSNDGAAAPTGQDRDPSYDDSIGQDSRAPAYNVELSVSTDSGRVGALQIELTHLGNSGGFIGRGDKVECTPLIEAIVAANYEGERVARIGMINLQGIRTPALLMRCGFRTRESVGPASFLVEVADASDTASNPIEPAPTVIVSAVLRR